MALVEPDALRAYLDAMDAPASAVAVADEAAATASTFVSAFCSRLRPGEPAPAVVARVAMSYAARVAMNPQARRGASTQGQSVDYAPVGLLYLESLLLRPYRRRSA